MENNAGFYRCGSVGYQRASPWARSQFISGESFAMIIQPRPPIYYMIMTSNPFPLDYRNRHYIYFFCQNSFGIVSQEFGELDYPGGFWVNIPFPETTRIQILGGNPIMVQCVDIPLIMSIVQVPRLVNDMYTVNRTTLSAFSTGLLNASAYSELAIDFTVYAINGGSSPTVSFL